MRKQIDLLRFAFPDNEVMAVRKTIVFILCISLGLVAASCVEAAMDRYQFDDRVWNDDVEGVKAALTEGLEEGVLSRDLSEYARSSAMLSVLIPAGMPVDRQALLRFVPSETPEDTAERLKLLIEGGADVHVQNGWRETPLVFMARLCHVDRPAIGVAIVRTLLAAGADPNAGEPDTRPPLFEWRNLSSECVRLLLEAGARADATWNGTTVLQYFGDLQPVEDAAETVRLLLAAGADPDAHPKGTDGTPLATLQGNAQSAGVVKALLDAGARPNGGSGTNPLRTAAGGGKGRLESVKLLLAAGAKADAPDEWSITPLMIAGSCTEPQREDEDLELIGLLLNAGANVDAKDRNGDTPLHYWIDGSAACIRLLVEKGAELEAVNAKGQTPLFAAVANNHPWAVEALTDAGANLNARSGETTPLDCARQNHYDGIARFLQSRGASAGTTVCLPSLNTEGTRLSIVWIVRLLVCTGSVWVASRIVFRKPPGLTDAFGAALAIQTALFLLCLIVGNSQIPPLGEALLYLLIALVTTGGMPLALAGIAAMLTLGVALLRGILHDPETQKHPTWGQAIGLGMPVFFFCVAIEAILHCAFPTWPIWL